MLNATIHHILECARLLQCWEDSAITIRSHRQSIRRLDNHLAVSGQAWQHTLLEEEDIITRKIEVFHLGEIILNSLCVSDAGHDVHRNMNIFYR